MAALFALALDTSAHAADPPSAEIALARRLFSEARTAEEAKDWPVALAKLRDAISIKETSGLRFHLAYCEEQQGMLVEALVDYERAEDLSVDKDEELRSQIPLRRTSLQKRIPTVTLLLARDPANARLTVDGHVLGSTSFGKPIPLNPGIHAFVVSSPGLATFSTELSLNEADAIVTNVALAPEPNSNSPTALRDEPPKRTPVDVAANVSPSRARTYVLIGEAALTVGAAAIGVAFTLEGASEDERADRDRSRVSNSACAAPSPPDIAAICVDLAGAVDSAQRDRSIARLGFISAGVGAAGFAATLLLWPSARSQAAIRPWVLAGSTGLSLVGRF
jgi:hypothetical protein